MVPQTAKTRHPSSKIATNQSLLYLSYIERVEHEYVVIILCQSDDVPLCCDLQAAATTDFDVRTLKLSNKGSITLENSNMETISMAVSHQHITSITDVDSVGEIGDVFTTDASKELAFLTEDYHTVALEKAK
jgi:hypothetical protein